MPFTFVTLRTLASAAAAASRARTSRSTAAFCCRHRVASDESSACDEAVLVAHATASARIESIWPRVGTRNKGLAAVRSHMHEYDIKNSAQAKTKRGDHNTPQHVVATSSSSFHKEGVQERYLCICGDETRIRLLELHGQLRALLRAFAKCHVLERRRRLDEFRVRGNNLREERRVGGQHTSTREMETIQRDARVRH